MGQWSDYIDVSEIPESYHEDITVALDKIWADEAGAQLIIAAYNANNNTRVAFTPSDTGYIREGIGGTQFPVTTGGSRTINTPGKAEVAVNLDEALFFEHGGEKHELSTERLLRHELYHIAYENDDLAQRMRPHIYSHVREEGGLSVDEFDKLQTLGYLDAGQVQVYQDRIESGEEIGLAMVESEAGKPMTTTQFNAFTEHLLAEHTDGLRGLIGDTQVDPRIVEILIQSALPTADGKELLERIENGESITLNQVEAEFGRIPFQHLSAIARQGHIAMQLAPGEQDALIEHLNALDPLVTGWNDVQLAHEEVTVDHTDEHLDGPDRGEYGNLIIDGGPDSQNHREGIPVPPGKPEAEPLPPP